MIICSKQEANGATREFLIEGRIDQEVYVKTHLSDEAGWEDAGVIMRGAQGLEVAVSSGADASNFTKLSQTFSNEIAALQAIAVSYHAN